MEHEKIFQARIEKAHQEVDRWIRSTGIITGGLIALLFLVTVHYCCRLYQLKSSAEQRAFYQARIQEQETTLAALQQQNELLQEKMKFIDAWRSHTSIYSLLDNIAHNLPDDVCLNKILVQDTQVITLEGIGLKSDSIMQFVQKMRDEAVINTLELKHLQRSEQHASFVIDVTACNT